MKKTFLLIVLINLFSCIYVEDAVETKVYIQQEKY